MTDLEFDILDELYFLTPYQELVKNVGLPENEVKSGLQILIKKGWVKVFASISTQLSEEQIDFDNFFSSYYYLATKEGLLAHNRI
jgi:hypothetical protein